MLKIEHVSFQRQKKSILHDVSLDIADGQIVSLLGPSGCGKTTLLRVVMGLDCPDRGNILFQDQPVTQEGAITVQPENRSFAFLFQDFTLLPHLNVERNILIGIRKHPKRVQEERLESLSELLHIGPLLKKPIHKLSGGEQQRVALARTLAIEPKMLLLDEPFSNLDKMTKNQLYHDVKQIIREKGVSAILATHDQEEAFFFSDQMAIMHDGKIAAQGTPSQLYASPGNAWIARFTGTAHILDVAEAHALFDGDHTAGIPKGLLLVRPEDIIISGSGKWIIVEIEYYGFYSRIQFRHASGKELSSLVLGQTDATVGEHVGLMLNKIPEQVTS